MAKKLKKIVINEQPPTDETGPGPDWEEVGDSWDSMYLFEGEGATFAGIYKQSVSDVGPNNSKVHIFLKDGIRVGLWGSSVLDRRMKGVRPGLETFIKHCGEAVSADTGWTYKEFKIWQKKPSGVVETRENADIPF